MLRTLSAALFTAGVALTTIPLTTIALITTTVPVAAQTGVAVSFEYFHDQLAPYGRWYDHPRWGPVWHPIQVERDFRPYYRGHWVYTVEFGWTWESNYLWSDIVFHYGRWLYDPYDGWFWVPGFVWGPSWVVWQAAPNDMVGWFPMPPDDDFILGREIYRTDWDWRRDNFGYADWYGPSIASALLAAWVFVDLARFPDRAYYRYAAPRTQIINIINNTTNITNYTVINNRIVNRSIDLQRVERTARRRIEPVPARQVVSVPIVPIVPVDVGRQIQVRERQRIGGDPSAPARARARPLPPAEARAIARAERRGARFDRDPQAATPQAEPQGGGGGGIDRRDAIEQRRLERQQQAAPARGDRERDVVEPRGQRDAAPAEPQRGRGAELVGGRQQRLQAEQNAAAQREAERQRRVQTLQRERQAVAMQRDAERRQRFEALEREQQAAAIQREAERQQRVLAQRRAAPEAAPPPVESARGGAPRTEDERERQRRERRGRNP